MDNSHRNNQSNKEKNVFIIDKSILINKIKPLYNNYDYDINSLLEFEITLPFYIPFADNGLFCFSKKEYILHFLYKQIEEKKTIYGHKNLPLENHYTKVTIGISYNSNIFKNQDINNIFFDIALKELNNQITAYTIYTKDESCYYLTKEMLFPSLILNIVDLKKEHCEKQLFNLHTNLSSEKKKLISEDLNNITRLHFIYSENLNPLIRSQIYVLKARRNKREGFYDDAVISIQIYIEIIIRLVYKEVLISLNKSTQEIEDILEKTSFINLVTRELQKYLGGSWDRTKEGTKINSWYINTYNIRNKIVHTGYYPNFNEVTLAIDSAMEFSDFIFNQIRKNKTKYPKLNSYFTNDFK